MEVEGVIKVCPDPGCEAVYHNCPKEQTRCTDCGGWIIKITEQTYRKKFALNYFQYNALNGAFYRPINQ